MDYRVERTPARITDLLIRFIGSVITSKIQNPKATEDGGDNADDIEESLILINVPTSTVMSYSAGRRKCSFHFLCHRNSC